MANRIKILLKRPNTQTTNSTPVQLAKTHSTHIGTYAIKEWKLRSPQPCLTSRPSCKSSVCVCVENQHVVYIIPNRYSKRYRSAVVSQTCQIGLSSACVFFRVENYFHLVYNMFLKSMFKDFSNDVLIETNSQLLWKLCSKQSSILHVCCSQTVPRFMSWGAVCSKKSFLHMCDTFLERTYKDLSNDVRSEVHA